MHCSNYKSCASVNALLELVSSLWFASAFDAPFYEYRKPCATEPSLAGIVGAGGSLQYFHFLMLLFCYKLKMLHAKGIVLEGCREGTVGRDRLHAGFVLHFCGFVGGRHMGMCEWGKGEEEEITNQTKNPPPPCEKCKNISARYASGFFLDTRHSEIPLALFNDH